MLRDEHILKELYFVKVPLIYTYEDYEIDTIGVHYNESYSFNINNGLFTKQTKPAYKDLTRCYLNLLRISEICYDGGTVYFINTADMEKAFNNIEAIIKKYKDNTNYTLNQFKDDVDDILDRLLYLNKSIYNNNNKTIKQAVNSNKDKFGLDLSEIPKIHTPHSTTQNHVVDLRNKTINMRFIKMFNNKDKS